MSASQALTISVTDVTEIPPGQVLIGSKGNNKLVGGAGNDKLYGKAGKDMLTGNAGQDVFVFDTRLGLEGEGGRDRHAHRGLKLTRGHFLIV